MTHLEEHGMNYFQHMRLAFSYSYKLLKMALAAVCHAILPFTFKTYVTDKLKELTK